MLIKITKRCGKGCSHCMEDSKPGDPHMTTETFRDALAFTRRIEERAWALGCPRKILLSGGEPTEHPEIVEMLEMVIKERLLPVLITNGLFLADEALRAAILRPQWKTLSVQVTHDPRYYPGDAPPVIVDERIHYVGSLSMMIPLGRLKKAERLGEVIRSAPTSFNLRSAARTFNDFAAAVCHARLKALVGLSGQCTPSVTHEGDVVAGESTFCWKLGTVHSSNAELTRAILEMGSCNRCGLESGLSVPLRRAIGLTTLYAADE